jgi:hypothetical protein
MKNFYFLLAAAGTFLSLSCGNCEDEPEGTPRPELVATYRLTSWVIPQAVDLNGDGLASIDLVNESDCYANSYVTLNDDNTYRIRQSMASVEFGTDTCESTSTYGHWSAVDNTIELISKNKEITHLLYAPQTENMQNILPDMDYPVRDESGHLLVASGNVIQIFKKSGW